MPVHLLSDVDVIALSIVEKGANRKRFYLRKQKDSDIYEEVLELPGGRILKADNWSAVYCVVAEPGHRENAGIGANTDLEDEWANDDEIRRAAHRFMKNGALVNRMHETLEPYGTIVENFVTQADLWVGGELIKTGSWVVGLEPTDEGREAIENGQFTGVSIQGTGVRTLQKRDAPGNEGPKAKKCPECGGTVKFDKATCQNCGHSFKMKKAVLSSKGRKALSPSAFVFPKEKRYPIHDRAHAANALARASGKPEEGQVRAAVCRRFPDLPACQKVKKVLGPPGTDISRNQAAAKGPLRHLIAFYMKKPHPFTACVRDNTKRFGPERAKRVCATLKDLGTGTTKWRAGNKKIAKAEDIPEWLVESWTNRWVDDGFTAEDAVEVLKALEESSGTVRSDMQTEESDHGLLRAIARAVGITKTDIEDCGCDDDTKEEDEAVADTATVERLDKIEETVNKSASQVESLANRIADIAEALAAKKKDEEEEDKTSSVKKEELTKKLDDVATSLDNLREEVEKLAEGSSSQTDPTTVTKSDDPLAGVLLGDF